MVVSSNTALSYEQFPDAPELGANFGVSAQSGFLSAGLFTPVNNASNNDNGSDQNSDQIETLELNPYNQDKMTLALESLASLYAAYYKDGEFVALLSELLEDPSMHQPQFLSQVAFYLDDILRDSPNPVAQLAARGLQEELGGLLFTAFTEEGLSIEEGLEDANIVLAILSNSRSINGPSSNVDSILPGAQSASSDLEEIRGMHEAVMIAINAHATKHQIEAYQEELRLRAQNDNGGPSAPR